MEVNARNTLLIMGMAASLTVIKKVIKKRIERPQRRRRMTWQEEWLRRRDEGRGTLNMLREELLVEDPEAYKNYLRMDSKIFYELLSLIKDDIQKQNTHLRVSVSAENRLALTLRYLASGNLFRDLMCATRTHESTISLIVPEVCKAIINRLLPIYIKLPATADEWKKIAREYERLWNFPMCVGALDGKHINFQAPISAGSFYYNYKGTHSIVLLALVDANYKFMYIDVGVNGRISDGGVFRESSLRKALDTNILNLPQNDLLPGTNTNVPFLIVADDAFPLTKRLMEPFSTMWIIY